MAESQDRFSYAAPVQHNLSVRISPSRLAPYLRLAVVNGDFEQAIKWYLWNARLAKAFLFPLHVVEVTVRNAIHDAFTQYLGGVNWIFKPPFSLTPEHQGALATALRRLKQGKVNPTSDDLVASLSLDFWSNLFREDYAALWSVPRLIEAVFPNAPAGSDRDRLQKLVRQVNKFRNRVAHHEPIHNVSAQTQLDRIELLTSYVCKDTASWMQNHSTVIAIARTTPTRSSNFSGPQLNAGNLRPPLILDPVCKIPEAIRQINAVRPPVALLPDASKAPPYALVSLGDIARFIEEKAGENDGLIDLNDHEVASLSAICSAATIAVVPSDSSTGDAMNHFFPKGKAIRPSALLVTKPDGTYAGIILRPSMKL